MRTLPEFHLSLGVRSLEETVDFYTRVLQAKITHRDPSGYVNLDCYGCQITLKEQADIKPNLPHFHFGINLKLGDFERICRNVKENGGKFAAGEPEVWDAGTALERKKLYLKCPTGYVIELKGYR